MLSFSNNTELALTDQKGHLGNLSLERATDREKELRRTPLFGDIKVEG
jgi:hypothetical protein